LITNVPSSYQGQDSIDGYRVYKRKNSLETVIYGTEAEMEYSLSSLFTAYGNIIYTYGQNISKNEPIRRIPPLNGRFGFRYRDQKGIKASTDWIFALKQDRLSNGDIADDRIQEGGTPGWNVVNINLGYTVKFLDIYAGLKNIFNAEYRIHGSGINGVGRCFWISVFLKFYLPFRI
jgi:outer membrane receptor for ferrienterochelin and colicin